MAADNIAPTRLESVSGALTSTLMLITKATFENSQDGLRKGARG